MQPSDSLPPQVHPEAPEPDGWILTPLPTQRRDEPGREGWFARTGEPPPRHAVRPPVPQPVFARVVLWGGAALLLVFAALLALAM